jgi:predicted lipid-binding transport protein (Tim44 family)
MRNYAEKETIVALSWIAPDIDLRYFKNRVADVELTNAAIRSRSYENAQKI